MQYRESHLSHFVEMGTAKMGIMFQHNTLSYSISNSWERYYIIHVIYLICNSYAYMKRDWKHVFWRTSEVSGALWY